MPKLINSRIILTNNTAAECMAVGANELYKAVAPTLGPRGRNAILISLERPPVVTKDGVTVADELELDDPASNGALRILRNAASRTADVAGDGTTTSTVLACELYLQAQKLLAADPSLNPIHMKRGVDACAEFVLNELDKWVREVGTPTEIEHVATISTNGDSELGKLVVDALGQAGRDGAVLAEAGNGLTNTVEAVEGLQIDAGYISPYFSTNPETMECTLKNARVLSYAATIDNVQDVVKLLQLVHSDGRPLVILAAGFSPEVQNLLVVNRLKGGMPLCAVKAPGWGTRRLNAFNDLAVTTGTRVYSPDKGDELSAVSLSDMGAVDEVLIDKDVAIFRGGESNEDEKISYVNALRAKMSETEQEDDRQSLMKRIGRLTTGVLVITTGGATKVEAEERKFRVEDAIHACRAAIESGTLPGAGLPLYVVGTSILDSGDEVDGRISEENASFQAGYLLLARVLKAPAVKILQNAGVDPNTILPDIKTPSVGYDITTFDTGIDMFELGVIDPLKVVQEALRNAVSAAGTLMTTSVLVYEVGEVFGADQLK